MNRFRLLFFCLVMMTNSFYPTTVNGRLLLNAINDSLMNAKIQINTSTGTDDMGGATIIIKFDTTKFYLPSILAADTDYVFQGFSGGNYSIAFITKPFPNELWINIELESNNNGTIVSGLNSWTDVVTIKMKSKGNQFNGAVNFNANSPFWAIFDGNNSTTWESGIFSQISSVEDDSQLPIAYSLDQNYPNPFNPSTRIRFTIAKETEVKLVVYNLLGELIRELVNNKIAAGNHEFTFDSDGLPSGTYIYKLEANNEFISVKKMILLK
jgi:hypothetical protein